jgi:hypothetical protein
MDPNSVRKTLAAVVTGSSKLLNLDIKASKTGYVATGVPDINGLPGRLDPFLDATWTRRKKGAEDPFAKDRFASELYPVARPPVHEFVFGSQARMMAREPRLVSR